MFSKIKNEWSNIELGYKRIWYIVTVLWLIFAVYVFGINAYLTLKNKDSNCTTHHSMYGPRPIYKTYSEIPWGKIYSCRITKGSGVRIGNLHYYALDGHRYITLGRIFIIIFTPLLMPIIFLLNNWVGDGFVKEE